MWLSHLSAPADPLEPPVVEPACPPVAPTKELVEEILEERIVGAGSGDDRGPAISSDLNGPDVHHRRPHLFGDRDERSLQSICRCGGGCGGRSRTAAPQREPPVATETQASQGEKETGHQDGARHLRRHRGGSPDSANIAKVGKKSAFFLDLSIVKKGQYAIA